MAAAGHAYGMARAAPGITLVFCLRVVACCRAIRSFSGLLTLLCGNFIILWFILRVFLASMD